VKKLWKKYLSQNRTIQNLFKLRWNRFVLPWFSLRRKQSTLAYFRRKLYSYFRICLVSIQSGKYSFANYL